MTRTLGFESFGHGDLIYDHLKLQLCMTTSSFSYVGSRSQAHQQHLSSHLCVKHFNYNSRPTHQHLTYLDTMHKSMDPLRFATAIC